MEQRIRDRFSTAILEEASRRYGVTSDQTRPLGGFESFIYAYEYDGQDYILRISHSLRRNVALIEGEVDWINYLADRGVSVARAVRSQGDRLVEAIDDGQGGCFLATSFVKARGQSPWRAGWTPQIYERYGEMIGRMHALAVEYGAAHPTLKRPEWDDEMFDFVTLYLPASESVVRGKYDDLLDYLHTLPKEAASYGLIHQDAHGSNLYVDEKGTLTLFDFDECAYSWFANDIAIVLFYLAADSENAPVFTGEFMPHFFRGYRKAYTVDPGWLKEIPHFLKLREIELYAVIHRDFDVNHIDHEWCAAFMRGRKQKIEDEVPFIDFDFEALAAYL